MLLNPGLATVFTFLRYLLTDRQKAALRWLAAPFKADAGFQQLMGMLDPAEDETPATRLLGLLAEALMKGLITPEAALEMNMLNGERLRVVPDSFIRPQELFDAEGNPIGNLNEVLG